MPGTSSSRPANILAWVGGFSLIVLAGSALAVLLLRFVNAPASPDADPGLRPLPTVTTEPAPLPDRPDLNPPTPNPTVTVTQPPSWPVGFWAPGSPCLIPFPGVELGLEYGFTQDPTIKSWVLGVQQLIQRLYERGWSGSSPGPVDGEYGAKTEAGVIGFQNAYGELQTGRVDANTWAALRNQCERFR